MWAFLSGRFLSIVKPGETDTPKSLRRRDVLLVRGGTHESLALPFPGARILRTPDADYPFQCYVPRDRVVNRVAQEVLLLQPDSWPEYGPPLHTIPTLRPFFAEES